MFVGIRIVNRSVEAAANHIGRKWVEIAIALGVFNSEIDMIVIA